MREILFKAKRIDNGEWVYWNVYGELVRESGKRRMLSINQGATTSYYYFIHQVKHLINKETICQYTGLTDKNGKKIWGNDVVCTPYVDPVFGDMVNDKILDDYAWKVVFIDGGFCVDNKYKLINLRSFTNGNHIKVVGNIFDNPELLEGGAVE